MIAFSLSCLVFVYILVCAICRPMPEQKWLFSSENLIIVKHLQSSKLMVCMWPRLKAFMPLENSSLFIHYSTGLSLLQIYMLMHLFSFCLLLIRSWLLTWKDSFGLHLSKSAWNCLKFVSWDNATESEPHSTVHLNSGGGCFLNHCSNACYLWRP